MGMNTIIDLFAGAGGLSEGFTQAGFDVIGHVEMDRHAANTLRTRMIYYELKKNGNLDAYKDYVSGNISRDELVKKYDLQHCIDSVICEKIGDNYESIINDLKYITKGQSVDIIIGGPPCQAYSNIGRARDSHGMRNDDRNFLYKYYVEFLKAFKPKLFVFENVPGLISAGGGKYLKDMRELMKKIGYETDFRILNAANYGVPQNRKRVILIGWLNDVAVDSYPEPIEVSRDYVVGDIFADLPELQMGGGEEVVTRLGKYAARTNRHQHRRV